MGDFIYMWDRSLTYYKYLTPTIACAAAKVVTYAACHRELAPGRRDYYPPIKLVWVECKVFRVD